MRNAMIPVLAAASAAIAITFAGAGSAASADPSSRPALPTTAGASAARAKAAAHRAEGCWWDEGKGHWFCKNRGHAPIYDGNTVVGYVDSTTSWFRCRTDEGADHGGPHPTRWELTQADTPASHPWGWMSDNDISSETDPLPGC